MHIRKKVIEQTFEETYADMLLPVYKFALSRLKNEEYAKECVQETFIVYYKKLLDNEKIHNTKAFLYKTASLFIKKGFNEIQSANDRLVNIDEVEGAAVEVNDVASKVDFEAFKCKLNKLLSADEKRLYELRFEKELSVKDVANILDITEANCSVRIHRLRKKIISELSDFSL